MLLRRYYYDFMMFGECISENLLPHETKGVTQIEVQKPNIMTIKAPDILIPAKGEVPKPPIAPVTVKNAQEGQSDLPPIPPIPRYNLRYH